MGKKTKKQAPGEPFRLGRLLFPLGIGLVIAGSLVLARFAMGQAMAAFDSKVYLEELQADADQDSLSVAAAFSEREVRLHSWAYALREAGITESGEILRSVAQGCATLGAERLYLADDDGFFYGSDGLVSRLPQYDSLLAEAETEKRTLRQDGRFLAIVQIRPFTVEGATFRWALAEFDDGALQEELLVGLRCGGTGGQLLDVGGGEVLRLRGDRSLYSLLDTAQIKGDTAASDLKQRILNADRVSTVCQVGEASQLLVSTKLPGRDWILLTLDPMPRSPGLLDPVMVLYLCAVGLLALAVCFAFLRSRQEGALRRQAEKARDTCAQLQTKLDGMTEVNRSQTELLDAVSVNVRTALNGIAGFTALAKRHIGEPTVLGEYLNKVDDASAQLLSKLNEGLDATGWHRSVEEETQPQETEGPIDVRGMRILLVEDNALNREIGEAILSELGMTVECAENGQLGFQKVATAKPGYYDLVLMDIQMPVMDGCEATAMIRRLRSKLLAEIPILAMTADVSIENRRRAFEAGMDGYVEKPINIDKLLRAIQKVLRKTAKRE